MVLINNALCHSVLIAILYFRVLGADSILNIYLITNLEAKSVSPFSLITTSW